jgi:IclR family pca regulon transcriptional regulator
MLVKPYVDELSSELDKTVNLAVLDGHDVLFLYRKEVRRFLNYDLQAGSKLPPHCTASGKILLAGLTDGELKKLIAEMELHQITSKTITSKKNLWKEIMKTRERGYSVCDRELSMDLYSIAVPLINDQRKTIAAINVSSEVKDKDRQTQKKIIVKLTQTGKLISRILGHRGPYPKFLS